MVICFFFLMCFITFDAAKKEKVIQVLPERYPHKHVDDLLKVRKNIVL